MRPERHSYTVGEPRELRAEEKSLLVAILAANGKTSVIPCVEHKFVQDMNDGGMGSLRFVGPPERRFGSISTDATFEDDGVQVVAAVIFDQNGELYELDIWKVDSSPLRRIPSIQDIQITPATGAVG